MATAAGNIWRVEECDDDTENIYEEEECTTDLQVNNLSENLETDVGNRRILLSSIGVNHEIAAAARSRMQHINSTDESVAILFAGKTGAGKSSLINGLVGRKIAEEGTGAKPVTGESALDNPYEGQVVQTDGPCVRVTVWDSPGLQDGYQEDKMYLKRLHEVVSQVDLLVYCISIQERFDRSTQRALKKFALLEPEIWSHTVIALTQSNNIIHPSDNPTEEEETTHFTDTIRQWGNEIRNVLQKCRIPNDVIQSLPFVPTGYHRVTRITPQPWSLHPKCDHWIQAFWVNCLGRCKERGQQALVASNRHRLSFNGTLPDGFRTLPIEDQPILCGNDDSSFAQQVCQGTHAAGGTELSWYIRIWHFLKKLFFKSE